jgi:Surface glycan-binding protein B xyloglucan binding domain
MKRNIIILSGFLLLFFIVISCEKSNEIIGDPVITNVTTSLDHSDGISEGVLNQWVMIHGYNLSSTQSVSFNNIVVEYKDIFSSDSLVSVQVPRKIPVEVTNEIVLTTKVGTANFSFQVNMPSVTYTRMRNEFTLEGDTLDILGENFDLYFELSGTVVTFTGGQTANVSYIDASLMKVVVPTGTEPGPITINGGAPLNTEISSGQDWFKDNRNPMITTLAGTVLLESHPDFPGNPDAMVVVQGTIPAFSWNQILVTYVGFPAEAIAHPENYQLKWEMNTKMAWTSNSITINFEDPNYWSWNYDYFGKPLNTNNKWETIALPLDVISPKANPAWMKYIINTGETTFDFAMCNWRIVPKNL